MSEGVDAKGGRRGDCVIVTGGGVVATGKAVVEEKVSYAMGHCCDVRTEKKCRNFFS